MSDALSVGTLVGAGLASVSALVAVIWHIAKFSRWMKEVDKVGEDFREFKKEVREDFKEVRGDIKKLFERVPSFLTDTRSPTHLSKLGEDVSEKIAGRKWAEEMAPTVVDQVKGCTPYEIQRFCYDYARSEVRFDETRPETSPTQMPPGVLSLTLVQSCAYENGVTVDEIMDVLAIELRDVLLGALNEEPQANQKPHVIIRSEPLRSGGLVCTPTQFTNES